MEPANQKAMKFKAVLDKWNIRSFREYMMQQSSRSIIFNTQWELEGRYLPVQVVFDDTIYIMIRVLVLENIIRKRPTQSLMKCLNQLNQRNQFLKYQIFEPGDVLLIGVIATDNENFDGRTVWRCFQSILQTLRTDYRDIARYATGKNV